MIEIPISNYYLETFFNKSIARVSKILSFKVEVSEYISYQDSMTISTKA